MLAPLYTYAYDQDFLPPFPVVDIELGHLYEDVAAISLVALIDSGSDGTMVPVKVLQQIRARKIGVVYIEGITGIRQPGDVYEITLSLAGRQLGRVEVVADRQNRQVILGRDVLNQFVITLNGLANVVEIAA